MFNFFSKTKDGEEQSILDLLKIDSAKAEISDMAIEKAAGMIAKAIAKSEFVVQRNKEKVKDDVYWMLNIKANPNETATEFWTKAIGKMLKEGECLIIHLNGGLYRVDKYRDDGEVTKGKTYYDVVIEANGDRCSLGKSFREEDVLQLRNTNKKIMKYLKKNLNIYNKIATGLSEAKRIASTPKFSIDVETSLPIIKTKDENGNEKTLTIDEYKKKVREMMESEDIAIITNQKGMKVNYFKIDSNVTTEDIVKIVKEIFTECAYAFDIPRAVFLGEITEKADSTNEFITYAVNWVVEILNDSMNAALVGKDGYLENGEKIWVDLSRYKHVDIIESAANLEKLRGIGFSFDEILTLLNQEPLETEFSSRRVVTKNFGEDIGGED